MINFINPTTLDSKFKKILLTFNFVNKVHLILQSIVRIRLHFTLKKPMGMTLVSMQNHYCQNSTTHFKIVIYHLLTNIYINCPIK